MNLGLQDRVYVVTGGGSGIGESITNACLLEGASVVIVSRRTPHVLRFMEAQQHRLDRCTFLETELADSEACRSVIEQVRRQHGRLDGLVNNAGTNDGIGLQHGTPELFTESLRNNLLHYYSMAHYALPMLIESTGTIVNISSKVALTGQGGTSAYAAAKGAQLALTREWAAELATFGIRVNCVLPAEVMTPLYEAWLGSRVDPAAARKAIEQRIPLGHRMTTPEEIAATVVFLLSPLQSGHTTGQQVVVDGGYTHLDRAL